MLRFFREILFTGIFVACLLTSLIGAAHAWQVSSEKLVKADDPSQITDAVLITEVDVAGRSIECGFFIKPALVQPILPFQADSDWLKMMSISLINRTEKTIVAGEITLNFLDTGNCRSQPCVAEQIHIGQLPSIDAYNGRTGQPLKLDARDPLDWAPDQAVVVHVGDYMDEIVHNLSDHLAVTSVNR